MRKKKKEILLENVLITDIASKGKAVARYDGRVIFVNGAVPGDICDIVVYRRKKKYWEARLENIKNHSKHRTFPKCEHFGVCGGCKWQNMKYESQLEFKEKEVLNNLRRIGGVKIKDNDKIIASTEQYYYRNKMEFTFSNKKWLTEKEINSKKKIINKNSLGFHIPGKFDKVLDLKACYLQKSPSNDIRLSLKKFADKNNLSYFDIRKQSGFLRNLIIKTTSKNDLMVLVQFYENNISEIYQTMDHLKFSFPNISSLMYTINQKGNNTIYDQNIICYHGNAYITEEIDGLSFKIGAKSFFQTNTKQAKILYKKTKELAQISTDDVVYDLYTGTGTIAQYLANNAKKVIGIDSVAEGIQAAKENSKQNKIDNCFFYTGDMKEIFTKKFIEENGKPDVIISDPPRDGMHKKVIKEILNIQPKRIVYVSCNSATQARDLSLMSHDYRVTKIQPIDMFPQTHHVENIIVLEKLLNS